MKAGLWLKETSSYRMSSSHDKSVYRCSKCPDSKREARWDDDKMKWEYTSDFLKVLLLSLAKSELVVRNEKREAGRSLKHAYFGRQSLRKVDVCSLDCCKHC